MNPKIKVDDFVNVEEKFFAERDKNKKYPELSVKNYNSSKVFDVNDIIEKNGDKFYVIQFIVDLDTIGLNPDKYDIYCCDNWRNHIAELWYRVSVPAKYVKFYRRRDDR